MSQLKAFIGHSFTEDDEAVVRAYLKFFDQIKNMNIGFSWEHAEAAEPKELAAKVSGLIEDKNLFIGICTQKEVVIQSDKLRRGFVKKNILKAEEMHFELKTSDWIIQEIGLAKGRNMDLILLVERGVRQPGGLQGNVEYITFERHSPDKSFGKVLEMIQALLPKAKAPMAKEAESRPLPQEESGKEKQEASDRLQPKPDWNRLQYEIALMRTVAFDDNEGQKQIAAAYSTSKEGLVKENRESWEAFHEYVLMLFGKGGKLTRLEEIAKKYAANSEVLRILARGYQGYEDYEKAATWFEVAAEKSSDPSDMVSRYSDALLALIKAGKKKEASMIVAKLKALASKVENGEVRIISAFRQVAQVDSATDHFLGLSERLLHLKPSEIDVRFDLPYKYSQANQDDVSLFHYLKIPYQERGGAAWNNLGVELDHFDLAGKSVEAYRKAEKLDETLAMSNLAYKLIKVGFLHEAEELCNKATKIQDYHKNVSHAIARIKDIPEEEGGKEREILDKALPLSEFYRDYGYALVQEDQGDHAGRWQGPECELRIRIKGNHFEAEGTYEQPSSGLGLMGYALGISGSTALPKTTQYRMRYEGQVDGKTVKCTMSREEVVQSATMRSLLGSTSKGVDVLMIINESLSEIRAYEKGSDTERKFYSLTRIE